MKMESYSPKPTIYFFLLLIISIFIIAPVCWYVGILINDLIGDRVEFIPDIVFKIPAIIVAVIVFKILEGVMLRAGFPMMK